MPPPVRITLRFWVVRSSVRAAVVHQHLFRGDAIALYLVEGFQWNLPQIIIMWVETAENVFQARGPSHRPNALWVVQAHVSTVWGGGYFFFIFFIDNNRKVETWQLCSPETSTISPGTSSWALICWTPRWLCRITFAISGSYSFKASMALSALRSYTATNHSCWTPAQCQQSISNSCGPCWTNYRQDKISALLISTNGGTAPKAWNRLPTKLKTSTCSTDSFKRSLKTFLFKSAYSCKTHVSWLL